MSKYIVDIDTLWENMEGKRDALFILNYIKNNCKKCQKPEKGIFLKRAKTRCGNDAYYFDVGNAFQGLNFQATDDTLYGYVIDGEDVIESSWDKNGKWINEYNFELEDYNLMLPTQTVTVEHNGKQHTVDKAKWEAFLGEGE